MERTAYTICDCCGEEIETASASNGIGEYEGGVLCSECYAVELSNIEDTEVEEDADEPREVFG